MSEQMVGRVAKAIYESCFVDEWPGGEGVEAALHRQAARAALEALREPTEAMVRAAYDCAPGWAPYEAAKSDYQAMIDAALK